MKIKEEKKSKLKTAAPRTYSLYPDKIIYMKETSEGTSY